jgi:hypothetical protein
MGEHWLLQAGMKLSDYGTPTTRKIVTEGLIGIASSVFGYDRPYHRRVVIQPLPTNLHCRHLQKKHKAALTKLNMTHFWSKKCMYR